MTKFETMDKLNGNIVKLNDQELLEVEGGIDPVTAGLIVLGVIYGSGLIVGLSGR